jgi:hypothetical protein
MSIHTHLSNLYSRQGFPSLLGTKFSVQKGNRYNFKSDMCNKGFSSKFAAVWCRPITPIFSVHLLSHLATIRWMKKIQRFHKIFASMGEIWPKIGWTLPENPGGIWPETQWKSVGKWVKSPKMVIFASTRKIDFVYVDENVFIMTASKNCRLHSS